MPRLKDLEAGDVIMTMLNSKPPALHTQIYTEDSHFPATIIHAVDDSGRKLHKVMPTSVKGSPDLWVYRCQDAQLAIGAAVQAMKWAAYETPFDQQRKYTREALRSQLALNDQDPLPAVQELFKKKGKFRAIKYAARRDDPLCSPKEDGTDGRGVNCAMFALLCYQAAALRPHVKTPGLLYPDLRMVRVSDKKISPAEVEIIKKMKGLDPTDLEQYLDYANGLHSDNEFAIDWDLVSRDKPIKHHEVKRWIGYMYLPSLLMWSSSTPISRFAFDKEMGPGLMLDAKVVTSEQFRLAMEADKERWKLIGPLEEEASPPDPAYKSKLQAHRETATTEKQNYKQQAPLKVNGGSVKLPSK